MKAPQYYVDDQGEKIPARYVTPYEKKRDRIAKLILKDWEAEERRLNALKDRTLERIEDLREESKKAEGVRELGGAKGNVQFRSFDGRITISIDKSRRTEFDERLALAQELIMQAVREMADGEHNADLIELATKAFQPRRSGNLDMQRIRDLRAYKVRNKKWQKAIQIIADCERTVGHRRYVRVSHREGDDAQPRNIILDIAKV